MKKTATVFLVAISLMIFFAGKVGVQLVLHKLDAETLRHCISGFGAFAFLGLATLVIFKKNGAHKTSVFDHFKK